jgi:death-on-curing protein
VLAIHNGQLAEHGGAIGVRDEGLLEGALARPQNQASCAEPDLAEFAAMCAIAIARNDPFVDGNKRTALAAMVSFIWLNGGDFVPTEVDATITTLKLAAGELTDEAFTAWVRDNVVLPSA